MKTFKVGDRVQWNSEAGRVTGEIVTCVISDIRWKGYFHHATSTDPQYVIKSDKTNHLAIHKATALRLSPRPRRKRRDTRR